MRQGSHGDRKLDINNFERAMARLEEACYLRNKLKERLA